MSNPELNQYHTIEYKQRLADSPKGTKIIILDILDNDAVQYKIGDVFIKNRNCSMIDFPNDELCCLKDTGNNCVHTDHYTLKILNPIKNKPKIEPEGLAKATPVAKQP